LKVQLSQGKSQSQRSVIITDCPKEKELVHKKVERALKIQQKAKQIGLKLRMSQSLRKILGTVELGNLG